MMSPTWIPSPNYTPGRPIDPNNVSGLQAPVSYIVLHHTWCTLDQADAEFRNDHGGIQGDPTFSKRRSVHFSVDEETVHQYVRLADSAWGAGTWSGNCGGVNIESVEYESHPFTQGTKATLIELVTMLCERLNIVPHPTTILPHSHFISTACPGSVPVAEIINAVRNNLGHEPHPVTVISASNPPVTVVVASVPDTSSHQAYPVRIIAPLGVNVRISVASTKSPVFEKLKHGDEFLVHSSTMGDLIAGVPSQNTKTTNVWYVSEEGYKEHLMSGGHTALRYVWSGACQIVPVTQTN